MSNGGTLAAVSVCFSFFLSSICRLNRCAISRSFDARVASTSSRSSPLQSTSSSSCCGMSSSRRRSLITSNLFFTFRFFFILTSLPVPAKMALVSVGMSRLSVKVKSSKRSFDLKKRRCFGSLRTRFVKNCLKICLNNREYLLYFQFR